MLLPALLLTCSLSVCNHQPVPTDTVPKEQDASTIADSLEVAEAEGAFQNAYKVESYPFFSGLISRLDSGIYRFDALRMTIYWLASDMTTLLSRGVIYPTLFSAKESTDTLMITNLRLMEISSTLPQVRRFSCWVFSEHSMNPTWYVFELTNEHGTMRMKMASFVREARLTFLFKIGIII
jgi:hypothetical protein